MKADAASVSVFAVLVVARQVQLVRRERARSSGAMKR
jgi:hypothetical protein